MEIGSSVWCPSTEEAWERGEVVSLDENEVRVQLGDLEVRSFAEGVLRLCNTFEGEDGDITKVQDLTTLVHLHEAAILHSLSARHAASKIYTWCGPVLLAVNPFQRLPLYDQPTLLAYDRPTVSDSTDDAVLPPHIFAVANDAYRSMVASGDERTGLGRRNQSVLVSGESGAGKTESCKFMMRFLATVARGRGNFDVSKSVLASNPILEAFGNARTLRNDNSSRFGKFIEMDFDRQGSLVGARIRTYLLEKVRVARQEAGERNFHIFYLLQSGCDDSARERWMLPEAEDCGLMNQSGCFLRNDGVDDAQQYALLIEALRVMHLEEEEIESVFRVVMAVIHLGNLSFEVVDQADGDEASCVCRGVGDESTYDALKACCTMLGLEADALEAAVTTRKLKAAGEWFTKRHNMAQSAEVRDALAKDLYHRLFVWLVDRVNRGIAIVADAAAAEAVGGGSAPTPRRSAARRGGNASALSFIGVLDIFGFEVFEHNSFEQLCINYANEKLQAQFNAFVFKLEQKEYEKEKIEWTMIDFPDNQPVLDLIEAKMGLLALLDEQCLFPNGNDKSLAAKLYTNLGSNECFEASRAHQVAGSFVVKHYAGPVIYSCEGFCDKNKDTLWDEMLTLFGHAEAPLVRELFAPMSAATIAVSGSASYSSPVSVRGTPGSTPGSSVGGSGSGSRDKLKRRKSKGGIQSSTVGSQFKRQLHDLLFTIDNTSPHYVRCLKPNDHNVPNEQDRVRLLDQLAYGGVLEAVRVARAGYPTRMLHDAFAKRYFMVTDSLSDDVNQQGGDVQKQSNASRKSLSSAATSCLQLLDRLGLVPVTQYQLGLTKVFLRRVAYEKLEHARAAAVRSAVIKLQARFRVAIGERRYRTVCRAALRLQTVLRGVRARIVAKELRREAGATRLQAAARRHVSRRRYARCRSGVIALQSRYHGSVGRAFATMVRETRSATLLQAALRASRARHAFIIARGSAGSIQRMVRCVLARRQLRSLRSAARDVGTWRTKAASLTATVQRLTAELATERDLRAKAEAALEAAVHAADSPAVVEAARAAAAATTATPAVLPPNAATATTLAAQPLEVTGSSSSLAEEVAALKAALAVERAARREVEADLAASMEEQRSSPTASRKEASTIAAPNADFGSDMLVAARAREAAAEAKHREVETKLSAATEEVERLRRESAERGVETSATKGRSMEELEEHIASMAPSQLASLSLKIARVLGGNGGSTVEATLAAATPSPPLSKVETPASNLGEDSPQSQHEMSKQSGPIVLPPNVRGGSHTQHLEEKLRAMEQRLESAMAEMCDAENRANSSHNDLVSLRIANKSLHDKMASMEALAEQSSGVKIALARRLEQLILDNRSLRDRLQDGDERAEALRDTNKQLAMSEQKMRKRLESFASRVNLSASSPSSSTK